MILEQMLETPENTRESTAIEPTGTTNRLTSGQVIVAMANIGAHLERAVTIFRALPECTPKDFEGQLGILIDAAKIIQRSAERLIGGNR